MYFEFKSQIMVFSTCENIGDSFESLRGRFHRNGRIRPIGRFGVTVLIGRLRVKITYKPLAIFSKFSILVPDDRKNLLDIFTVVEDIMSEIGLCERKPVKKSPFKFTLIEIQTGSHSFDCCYKKV